MGLRLWRFLPPKSPALRAASFVPAEDGQVRIVSDWRRSSSQANQARRRERFFPYADERGVCVPGAVHARVGGGVMLIFTGTTLDFVVSLHLRYPRCY